MYSKLEDGSYTITAHGDIDYWRWSDNQPGKSVLYISIWSFLSVSSAQMDEIAGGLRDSGVLYLWVVRGETSRLKDCCPGVTSRGCCAILWEDFGRIVGGILFEKVFLQVFLSSPIQYLQINAQTAS